MPTRSSKNSASVSVWKMQQRILPRMVWIKLYRCERRPHETYISFSNVLFTDDIDLELRLARFEHLMERRLLLLNSVLLRQNPHNVQEWHKRVMLYEGQPHEVCRIFNQFREKNISRKPEGHGFLIRLLIFFFRLSIHIRKPCRLCNHIWQ